MHRLTAVLLLGLAGLLALAGAGAVTGVYAQELTLPAEDLPVTLVADRLRYENGRQRLIAEGSVQVFYGARTLTASRIVYNERTGTISAEGPLTLRDPDGATLYASYAELDAELRNGLLRSAQAVLEQRFRIAAVEGQRVDGRYNVLDRAVFSNCTVCPSNPVPIWRIRAGRVIHDQEAQLIHYEDATFDVAGVPVFYLPYFRHPDPTLERGTGFLMPSIQTSDTFAYGVRTPFYWAIDAHSDLTVTPFLTTDEGPLLEAEYRHAFARGDLAFFGVIKLDDGTGNRGIRGRLIGEAYHYLSGDIFARIAPDIVSDDGFLTDFEYADIDRLTSDAAIASYRDNGYWEVGAAYFQSLRDGERVGSIPVAFPEVDIRQTWEDTALGGILGLQVNAVGLRRSEGQDVVRTSFGLDWERSWYTMPGVVVTSLAAAQADLFRVWESTTPRVENGFETRFAPTLGLEARYPLIRATDHAIHVLEPVAQLHWSESSIDQDRLPNEDSLLVELDATNLFDVSRFAGYDRIETGFRANLGIRYERIDDRGWSIGGVLGRVLRTEAQDVFEGVPALSGAESDYVAALTLSLAPYASFVGRVLLRDDFEFDRNEFRLDLAYGDAEFTGSYVYLSQDILGGALEEREEGSVFAGYRLSPNWRLAGGMTYDIQNSDFVRARAAITWANDCVEVDFSVSRRFTSSSEVDASTSFGLQVRLAGLGAATKLPEAASACAMQMQ
ncbi:MAG: LPS assembly protein LptD [Pseudomonadota bacterium]